MYAHALKLFQHGYLEESQREAELSYLRFEQSDPTAAARFQVLAAESMVYRRMSSDALKSLADFRANPADHGLIVSELAVRAIALKREEHSVEAHRELAKADEICRNEDLVDCGDASGANGVLDVEEGELEAARQAFVEQLNLARSHKDMWRQATANSNLGWVALHLNHFDEAVDWSTKARKQAEQLGAENMAQVASGNLGWAFYQLGDYERALEEFLDAQKGAARLGNFGAELGWISTAGYVYRDSGNLDRAAESYRQALNLARQIKSKEDIINALEDLAQVSVISGKLDEAGSYIDQVTPMERTNSNRLSANVLLTQGELAATRKQYDHAESLFRAVQSDSSSATTLRLNAVADLAELDEQRGNAKGAEQNYKTALNIFDTAQAELKSEESQLPFVANASRIYDDYIDMLVGQHHSDEALQLADQSRARTLAQALAGDAGKASPKAAALNPRQIAQKTGSTLLFYWLGRKQSYLWVITPAKVTLFQLAPRHEIAGHVDRYSKFLLNRQDPVKSANEDGNALYQLLVAPAASLIRSNTPVMILVDGELSKLNFETLLVPGRSPYQGNAVNFDVNQSSSPGLHYMLEDATLLSAPSLAMLAAAKPAHDADRSLLLFGNPVSPSDDFPSWPLFGFEMTRLQKHFVAQHVSVFSGQQATPASYLSSDPAKYSYIHFVSHAVASRTDPLDSAIILSDSKTGEDSYKLYARDIMKHPIGARLVTISACYGSGTRSYAGEGLVGLSWAFLRAGAHSVIGALWEVSDDSSPRLMDKLYEGLEAGQAPGVALRNAKLDLAHAGGRFNVPFYWAPFQIYTVQ